MVKQQPTSQSAVKREGADALVAAQPVWVVFGKSVKPAFAILRLRLGLLKLRTQIGILALKRPDALSQQGQVLAEYRRRCALVDKRLQSVEQAFKHFWALHVFRKAYGSQEGV